MYRPLAIIGVVLAGIVCGSVIVARTQRPLAVSLAERQSVQVAGPLKVDFGQDVAAGYEATITPHVIGTWKQQRTVLGVKSAWFVPAKHFEAGQTYHLRITGMRRALTGGPLPAIDQTFTAQVPSAIQSYTPAAGATGIAAKPQLKVVLAEANHGVRELQPFLTPAVALKLVSTDDKVFIWELETPLKQGTVYTFVVEDGRMLTPEKRRLVTAAFTTVTQPGIVSARTGGLFGPGQMVDIVFDQPMKAEATAFVFDFKGKGSWIDDHTYRYVPEGLVPGKTYTYTVKAGLLSQAGGALEVGRPFQFSTNGAVTASLSPGGTVGVNSPIRVTFDQPVDHASAQAQFSISPTLAGSFSWAGNTMVFTPSGAAYQTGYSFGVAAGVVPTWGLPSTKAMRGSYTTENQIVKLGVPVYKQGSGRSCELASLRMLLAYRGIMTSEADILAKVGYNPRARDIASNSWENPNETFVGYLNTTSWSQGYGVHAGPIAAAARSYGRGATSHMGVSAAFISSNIHAGNPVAFWGHISPPKLDSWNTPSGVVQTTTSMHARVAYGVSGSASAPIGFYVHDPWTGTSSYWTAAQLMANMNAALPASNQAVVVF